MTHTHARLPRHKPEPQPTYQQKAVLTVFILLVVLAVLYILNQLWNVSQRTAYSYTHGKVIESRIVIAGTLESTHGGAIYYQIESHVNFDLNGQRQDRWLPASDKTTAREMLTAQLAQQPKTCRVYWPPEHPQDLKCQLE
jgi:hypothetical protein